MSIGPQDWQAVRGQFPFFREHPNLLYLDSASTTQKPQCVIDALQSCLFCASNAGRGSYRLSHDTNAAMQRVRGRIAGFIGAQESEVVFTSGATQSLNMAALCWGFYALQDGDEVLVCMEDHKSCVLPWMHLQQLLALQNKRIAVVPYTLTAAGDADIEDIRSKITPRTRVIALTHIHNVFGTRAEVRQIRDIVGNDIIISLDASQSVGHVPIDTTELGIDFLSFSGHKMFAATGIGVLWVNERLHGTMQPMFVGGGIGHDVQESGRYQRGSMPHCLEAGTPNIAGILSLEAAIDLLEKVSMPHVHTRLRTLTQRLLEGLIRLPNIDFPPGPAHCGDCFVGYGLLSFHLQNMRSSDAGFLLDQQGICVRTGSHCRANESGTADSIRVSMHIYNTEDDVDRCIDAIASLS